MKKEPDCEPDDFASNEFLEGTENQPCVESFISPAIDLLDHILRDALQSGASHIHLHPGAACVAVRFRIDGVLTGGPVIPKALERALVGRIKVLSRMDLTERRRPQTGAFELNSVGNPVFRVEVAPSLHGESITLTIIRSPGFFRTLDDLGLTQFSAERLLKIGCKMGGIVLVAGPTGSGRGTLLRALIRQLHHLDRQFVSIEQVIREELEGVCQLEAVPSLGCDTVRLLASARRLDVDVLMCSSLDTVDEFRQAFELAAEGCTVLAGISACDAPSTLSRLTDMGLGPGRIASHLTGVVGLRLVRKLCQNCRAPHDPSGGEVAALGVSPEQLKEATLYRAIGCPACRSTGYSGRTGLHEVMEVNDSLRSAIWREVAAPDLTQMGRGSGFVSLRDDGVQKVMEGITTPEEVIRALG